MKGEDDIRTNAMDRLVKVGPSAVSTDLVPGRSERPTEPDRDTASGIHREVYTPRGILGRSSSSRPIVDSQPSRTTLKMEGGDRKRRRNGQCAEYTRESTSSGRHGLTLHRKYN